MLQHMLQHMLSVSMLQLEEAEALLDSYCASLKHSMIRTCEHTSYNHHLTAQVLCTYAIVTFVMYVLAGALTLLQCGYAQ
jgi:hypothetical protein